MLPFLRGLKTFLGSNRFFYISLLFFVFQAVWIALSTLYPMAFDENTHLGIIRLYSEHTLPFWSEHPGDEALFGAVARDPSYLYHYLMSFPYRLISTVFESEIVQVLTLRITSIGFFAAGLIVYRKVLGFSRASKALINTVFALMVLTPVVPFLAAQINYDNLIFLLSGCVILLTLQIAEKLKAGEVDSRRLLVWLILCLLTSLVKYAFLPVAFASLLYLVWQVRGLLKQKGIKNLLIKTKKSFKVISRPFQILLVILLVAGFGLFFERYGINTIRYHTPTPECDQVLGIEKCMDYGPWRRNYLTHQDFVQGKLKEIAPRDPAQYLAKHWIPTMIYKLFYVSTGESTQFKIGQPLPVSLILAAVFFSVGTILLAIKQRELRRKYNLDLFLLVTALLAAVLFAQNYGDLLHIGYPFAIQSRYLLPVLPFIYLFVALGFASILTRWPSAKTAIAGILMAVILTQCSGIVTYVVRSDDWWYWNIGTVRQINRTARNILKPLVIGAKQALPTLSL